MTSRPEDIDIQLACDGVCVLVGFLFFWHVWTFIIFCHAFMTLSRLSYFILDGTLFKTPLAGRDRPCGSDSETWWKNWATLSTEQHWTRSRGGHRSKACKAALLSAVHVEQLYLRWGLASAMLHALLHSFLHKGSQGSVTLTLCSSH